MDNSPNHAGAECRISDEPQDATGTQPGLDDPQTERQSRARLRSARTVWTWTMDRALLNGLIQAKGEGLDKGNGNFRIRGWEITVSKVQELTKQPMTREICENRWRKMKRTWKLWEQHKASTSDWTWDPAREAFVNQREVMDVYFNAHPEMEVFRDQGLMHKDMIERILPGGYVPRPYGTRMMRVQPQSGQREVAPADRPETISPAENPTLPSGHVDTANNTYPLPAPAIPAIQKRSATDSAPATAADQSQKRLRANNLGTGILTAGDILTSGDALAEPARELAAALIPPYQRASSEFLKEMDLILPASWRDGETSRIPFSKYCVVLKALQDPFASETYIALLSRPRDDRIEFIMNIIGQTPESISPSNTATEPTYLPPLQLAPQEPSTAPLGTGVNASLPSAHPTAPNTHRNGPVAS
ncbi:hypothetical protein D8B26_000600 [Coccidioides posadasii str. Silveira]|uniref:Uncharacterized protein n=3 Tax=Coccidioides posadasii TaxID=199306 RepID=E9DFY7_COCPS|nr:hypothetical protein CPC735_035810 [Coccidioides posadasii C735 delta SOWgp]EER28875.1 hypothetical protein CPC735_035810 [Coccidioides posadasii C735 delta SOWgp]EFW14729.1 conserved hypothetical protein [Coccidioides posadasii str. Silveira]KMM63687.1 hypothetical protein CPAG_00041 [Coccidioides posadasii RMSCC 3488]QVM05893.1 hypothetical protein D8B26_000600 [Coccidioides posadasii str. Silveira]|eukprot:XP_003071020.1 hypothetical protein CPC735_035810 [Coccidioides posadasii C735 delta SOWgp]